MNYMIEAAAVAPLLFGYELVVRPMMRRPLPPRDTAILFAFMAVWIALSFWDSAQFGWVAATGALIVATGHLLVVRRGKAEKQI
jgi:hypothetical protein